MLSIGKIHAGPGAARYYTDQVALGREDYYAGEGEAPGRWVGSAAAAAGFHGEVEAGQFVAMLAGAGLRKPVREGAIAGFDLTFRAPKSVSVLWGIADPETVRQLGEAHDAAVEAGIEYLEREACWGRRGAGGAIQVPGDGFVAAAFRHRASRAGDPLLHTHVVAGNLTRGPDDRWTAPDARHLYRHAMTAGFLYQAELRREIVERLGLEWGPVERGTADIGGSSAGSSSTSPSGALRSGSGWPSTADAPPLPPRSRPLRRGGPSRSSTPTCSASSGEPAPPSTD